MASHSPTSSPKASPVITLILGVILLFFWVLGTVMQIQTSEAYFMHADKVAMSPDLAIIMQPVQFVSGTLPATQLESFLWGWGIELALLICVVGYEMAHESLSSSHRNFARFLQTGACALIFFDFWSDVNYNTLATFWQQVGFACVLTFIVVVFGVVAERFIRHGLTAWGK